MVHIKKKLKYGFPIVFSKSDLGGGDLEYAQVLVVTWAKLNSVTALLSHRPIGGVVMEIDSSFTKSLLFYGPEGASNIDLFFILLL